MVRLGRAILAGAVVATACRGGGDADRHGSPVGGGATGGTVVIAVSGDVKSLIPPYATSVQSKLVASLLFDRLAEIGDNLNTIGDAGFTPRLAERWVWAPDSLSIAFHLDPRARWHDGVPVRAEDVRFTFRMDRDSTLGTDLAPLLARIDSVTTPDSLTAVFWFSHRYPEQFFDATYQMLICPAHLLGHIPLSGLPDAEFARHPIGTGRFRFVSWTPDASLEVVADTGNYRGRALLDRVILSVAPDFTTALARLFAGEADVLEALRPENLAELARHPELRGVPYTDPSYGFLWFNLHDRAHATPHPLFGNRALRRALGMALDRDRMVRNVFDSLGRVATGPFYHSAGFADPTIVDLPYDTVRANRTLDSLGWRRGADGVRVRNGRPLAFPLTVPTSSAPRMRFAALVQDQLARVGVRVSIDALEFGAYHARLQAHDFDAAINVFVNDPSPSGERQTWATAGEHGGLNWGSYANPAFDAALDSALGAMDPVTARAHFHSAFQTITDDAPAVWLYEPQQIAGVHRRLRLAPFRADAWWAHLADWSIPADARIARDRIGLGGR
jgi:peptide/nickel transport system substrate-binding protein